MVRTETLRLSAPLRHVRLAADPVTTTATVTTAIAPVPVPPPAPVVPPEPAVDVDALVRAAYERGRIEGERAVSEQLVRQRVEFSELQNGILTSLRGTLPQIARDSEQVLMDLVTEAVGRIVAGIPVEAPLVEGVVREALAQAQEQTDVEVQLHPEDLELLRQTESPLLQPEGSGTRLIWTPAATLTRGGCLVRTRFGTVDARRETKLDNLRTSLAA
jgi:flagellar assembly protein FliH